MPPKTKLGAQLLTAKEAAELLNVKRQDDPQLDRGRRDPLHRAALERNKTFVSDSAARSAQLPLRHLRLGRRCRGAPGGSRAHQNQ